MICPNCGTENGNNKFCMNCGAPVAAGGNPNTGYGGPNMGSNPNTGYGSPNMGSNPNTGYGGPNMGGNPNMGYGGPNMGGNPNMGYGSPNMGGNPNMGYGGPNAGYGNPNMDYGNAYTGPGYGNYYNVYSGPPNGYMPPSGFDGEGAEYFGIYLLNVIVLIFTLGIAYPWVYCRNLHWRKYHTIINGRRLTFTGTAGELFANWIIWWLLSVVTCGIYGFWVSVRMHQWEMAHTCYADMNPVMGQTFEDSFYDGMVGERLGEVLVAYLMIVFTCGIATPWALVRIFRYDIGHSVVNGDRLQFSGTGAGYWGENQLIGLLNFITCGIYFSWGVVRINRWFYTHTDVYSSGNIRNPYRM